jgi:hypothetical protein
MKSYAKRLVASYLSFLPWHSNKHQKRDELGWKWGR